LVITQKPLIISEIWQGKYDQHSKIYICNYPEILNKISLPSYSFWNKGWKVLTFLKFDEKREITSRWVIRFTLKLQARLILTCWTCLHSKHVQQVKIYMPYNCKVNRITCLGVIALFYLFIFVFKHFCLIFQKLLEIKVKF
jgi:hypothetical protein